MFSNITTALKIVTNIQNIRTVVQAVYVVVIKLKDVVDYLQEHVNDTKLGKVLEKYLPVMATTLNTIIKIVDKYGYLIGVKTVAAQSSSDDPKKELEEALYNLKELLK